MKVASIECLFRSLNDASVPFVVVGGLAVVAHGYGRQTQDVDLVSDCVRTAFTRPLPRSRRSATVRAPL